MGRVRMRRRPDIVYSLSESLKKLTTAYKFSTTGSERMEVHLTLSESFRLLRDDPMSAVNITDDEPGEKLSNHGQDIIGNIMTSGAANKECGAFVACFVGILERKVSHIAQTGCQCLDRDSKSERAAMRCLDQVGHEELADGQSLGNEIHEISRIGSGRQAYIFIFSKDLVCLGLLLYLSFLNLPHPFEIFTEITRQVSIYWCIVH